jgi:hypothetical protein
VLGGSGGNPVTVGADATFFWTPSGLSPGEQNLSGLDDVEMPNANGATTASNLQIKLASPAGGNVTVGLEDRTAGEIAVNNNDLECTVSVGQSSCTSTGSIAIASGDLLDVYTFTPGAGELESFSFGYTLSH